VRVCALHGVEKYTSPINTDNPSSPIDVELNNDFIEFAIYSNKGYFFNDSVDRFEIAKEYFAIVCLA